MRTVIPPRISKDPNPFRRGSWEPGRFGLVDALIIKVVLVATALFRGFDYLTPSIIPPGPVSESMTGAFPLEIWGTFILVPTVCLALGLVFRVHFAIWIGHGLLGVVYATILTSLLLVYIDRPLLDGIRSATVLLTPMALHALLCARTGWRPARWDRIEAELKDNGGSDRP